MTTKHTPTPWKICSFNNYSTDVVTNNWEPVEEIGVRILRTSDMGKMSRENAEFIIRACNAHEELVKALKNLVEACELADNREELSEEIDGSLLDAANQALAKAGEIN